jgi:hypothetical protein
MLLGWLIVPVILGAYHYGPGQEKLRLDDAASLLARADQLAASQRWEAASETYEKALSQLPAGHLDEARRIKLQRAKVQMFARQLPEANMELEQLVDELEGDKTADPKLVDEAREALANSQYYMTWLMRLEGRLPEEWEPVAEGSRQTYRLLAEADEARGDSKAAREHREDLESVIRLARMDLDDLQGLDIPSQCKNCKSGQCKNPGKGKKPGQKKGKGPGGEEKPKDNRGASSGPPPDNSGS